MPFTVGAPYPHHYRFAQPLYAVEPFPIMLWDLPSDRFLAYPPQQLYEATDVYGRPTHDQGPLYGIGYAYRSAKRRAATCL